VYYVMIGRHYTGGLQAPKFFPETLNFIEP
jgi:hypothetical protein